MSDSQEDSTHIEIPNSENPNSENPNSENPKQETSKCKQCWYDSTLTKWGSFNDILLKNVLPSVGIATFAVAVSMYVKYVDKDINYDDLIKKLQLLIEMIGSPQLNTDCTCP